MSRADYHRPSVYVYFLPPLLYFRNGTASLALEQLLWNLSVSLWTRGSPVEELAVEQFLLLWNSFTVSLWTKGFPVESLL